MTQRIFKESKQFEKYWVLYNRNQLTREAIDDLAKLYFKYKDARNKCTSAILLSLIDKDDKIPPILFDALKYWDRSGYAGWVMTSNARLFNYYPKYRNKYINLMFNGNVNQRGILANSLFFFQEKLQGMSYKELLRLKKKFARTENNKNIKKLFLFKLYLKQHMKFVQALIAKQDPLGLIKQGSRNNIYESSIINMYGYFGDKKSKKQRLQIIKSSFLSELGAAPDDKILERLMDKVNQHINNLKIK